MNSACSGLMILLRGGFKIWPILSEVLAKNQHGSLIWNKMVCSTCQIGASVLDHLVWIQTFARFIVKMRQSLIVFKSRGVTLEGVIAFPSGLPGPFPSVAMCHPHPIFGGNMDNDLVVGMCRALIEEGFATLRFNFRGVGNSEGTFTKGEMEQEDVYAALHVLRRWPGVARGRIGLAGYSFGASMILTGISRYKAAKAFAFVSPPLGSLTHQIIGRDKRPKIFIVGDRDGLVPYASLEEKVDSLNGAVHVRVVPGADHSWKGPTASEAAGHVASFFVDALQK